MPKKRGPYRVRRHPVTQPLDPSYRIIPLTQDQSAIVDTVDHAWLSAWNWCARWCQNTRSFYAVRNDPGETTRQKTIYMAREVLKCGPGEQPDHCNHDTLDNRRRNLRSATQTQNVRNRRIRRSNSSGFIGVSWQPLMKQWIARIAHDGTQINLGYFSSREDAARAYNEAAKIFHGEFAHLNHLTD